MPTSKRKYNIRQREAALLYSRLPTAMPCHNCGHDVDDHFNAKGDIAGCTRCACTSFEYHRPEAK